MRFLVFIVLMLGITGIAWAQMTDAQVVEAVKSAQAQGKSQDEIILMLSQKGVTKEQVLRIKENYEREKIISFIIDFMEGIDAEISAIKIGINSRARSVAAQFMKRFV